MAVRDLTQRQKIVLDRIRQFINEYGIPPTLRELAELLSISSAAVAGHLDLLERKGYIHRSSHGSRNIHLTPKAQTVTIPVVGFAPAGVPVISDQNEEDPLILDRVMVGERQVFAVKVRGESMIERHITDGDYVLVEPSVDAKRGDIVVALLNGEVTVKILDIKNNMPILVPANSKMSPIPVKQGDDFRIIGVVVGIYRRFI